MSVILIASLLFLLGLLMGSFAGASVWRLRARELKADKKAGRPVPKREWEHLKPLASQSVKKDRSRCLHCGYQLRWYDLIPLVSWLSLGGKCRQCRHRIGRFEPLIEIGMAIFFALSFIYWPYLLITPLEIGLFVTWLLAGVALAILFAYDAKWFLLPDRITWIVVVLGGISVIGTMILGGDPLATAASAAGAVAILSGLYWVLYLLSKGQWIGFGDVKLGLGLGLLLGDWQLALLALFLANLIGCIVVIPQMIRKKVTRKTQIAFGPLLILGMVIAKLFGWIIIDWYLFGLL